MSPRTPQNIGRHELIGLQVLVESERCPGYSKIRGRVVDETKNTIVVFDGVKKRILPKGPATFYFTFPDKTTTVLKGDDIIGRPEDRTKTARRRRS